MPHISSRVLKTKDIQKIYSKFIDALQSSAHKSHTRMFLNEFLTRTEKIMLAKRFIAIYLLSKGVPISYIATSLKMSPATVQRMSQKHEIGKYHFVASVGKLLDRTIWDDLEVILRMGLPPIAGRGRWKFLYK